MKKLNFDFNLKDLQGNEITEAKANHILANLLVSQTKGDAIKLYTWGLELYKTGELNLDKSDAQVLENIIKESETLTVLAKGQILEQF